MGSNQPNEHVVEIRDWEVCSERLAMMERQLSEEPRLLSMAAGKSCCSIFRVPQTMMEMNRKSYLPDVVSIGPYHRDEPRLRMIEEHKWRYLASLLGRTQERLGLGLQDLIKAVAPMEEEARECYSETIQLGTGAFLEMMVLDGCFIVELFRKTGGVAPVEPNDPLFAMSWVLPFFYRDLIRLQNQIPFFVLERLFLLTQSPKQESGPSLSRLALDFFNNALQRPDEVVARHESLKGKHLLDLLRSSFVPADQKQLLTGSTPTHIIPSVSKLRRAGIEINPVRSDSFLVVDFRHGVMEMPTITIDDFMSCFLINCVAYEQCHKDCSKHFTSYASFLDRLVNTSEEVEYLCDRNIIENYLGTDGDLAHFINNLGKDVAFDIEICYLSQLFHDVHSYYCNSWHVQWSNLKYAYSITRWSVASWLAALVLLLLTLAETFFTIYPEVH